MSCHCADDVAGLATTSLALVFGDNRIRNCIFFHASVCIWKYWNCNITRNDVYSVCFFVYSCVGVRESQASEIEIYHCPSCRITHGPLICEYFSQYCTNFVRLFILICPTVRYLHIGYKIVLLWFQSSCHWSVIGKVEVHGKLVRESLHPSVQYMCTNGRTTRKHNASPSGPIWRMGRGIKLLFGWMEKSAVMRGARYWCLSARRLRVICFRYDTRCCFNVRSKADMSPLNLPLGSNN